jgi:hypothetical protein
MKCSKPLCLWLGMYNFPKYSSFLHYRSKEMSPVNTDHICCFEVLCFLNIVETVNLRTQKFIPPYCVTSVIKIVFNLQFFCFWRDSPQWARASSFTRFLDHTQRRTAVGMTPLDEWSACTGTSTWQHTTFKKNIRAPGGISAGEPPQTYDLDCAATGTGV